MANKVHPARRARRAAGVVGASTYAALVFAVSVDAEHEMSIDLAETLGTLEQARATTTTLDLSGNATPVPNATDTTSVVPTTIDIGGLATVDEQTTTPDDGADSPDSSGTATVTTESPLELSTVGSATEPPPAEEEPITSTTTSSAS